MRWLLIPLCMIPLSASSQLVNETLLAENFDSYDFCLNDDNQLLLTYERIWWHDNGNSEPSYDSSSIFLTRLDSIANPVGELWQLRRDSASVQGSPNVTSGGNQVSWMYQNHESNDSGYQHSIRTRLFDSQLSSFGDELIITSEPDDYVYVNQVRLNSDNYLLYWAEGEDFERTTIFGQLFSQANQVLGDEFIIYQAAESDTIVPRLERQILSLSNSSSGLTYLMWNELVLKIADFEHTSQLRILLLGSDGRPIGDSRVISENTEANYETYNFYLQNESDIILTYKTREELEDFSILYESWIHVLSNYSEDSEVETIFQLPAHQILQASNFPETGVGVYLFNEEEGDSVFAQWFDPSEGVIDEQIYLPLQSHFDYPKYQCLLRDRKLFLFESRVYHELYAHVYLLPEVASFESNYENSPNKFTLLPPYPNPFNPSTKIEYELPKQSDVSLIIYNMTGRKVQTLVSSLKDAGKYQARWNGVDAEGHQVPGGMYFARLQAGVHSSVVKMVYLR